MGKKNFIVWLIQGQLEEWNTKMEDCTDVQCYLPILRILKIKKETCDLFTKFWAI